MAKRFIENVTIENAQITWKNFSGEQRQFNTAGDRNFGIIVDLEQAQALLDMGYKVRISEATEEYPARAVVPVKIKYSERSQPRVKMLIHQGTKQVTLDQDSLFALDYANIEKVDAIIRANQYDFNGRQGVNNYLNALYVTIREDELERKYAAVPEADMQGNLKAIEGTVEEDPWATPNGSDDIVEEAPLELEARGF
jgi:hypothetical protein